jgi:Sap-like sulfolipid-1-addressing protein
LLELLLLAIAGAFYPTLLAIVVVVLGRPNPARVLAYFLAGAAFASVTIGLVAVLALDTASFGGSRRQVGAGVDLVVGSLAFVAGFALYRRQPGPKKPKAKQAQSGPSFSQRMLSHDSGWIIFALGMVLDLPGLWYIIALKDIALGGYSTTAEIALVIGFNIVMFTFVEVPLVAFVLAPEKTASAVAAFNEWLRRNVRHIVAVIVLGLGTWLIVRGVVALI